MSDYRISLLARNDISGIYRHIALDNFPAAERWLSRLHEQFSLLAQNPQMGELQPDLGRELRIVSFGSYVIFFRSRTNDIQIARVVHGARDVGKIFRRPVN